MGPSIALEQSQPGLSFELANAFRAQKLSSRTEHVYQHWITTYLAYYDLKPPKALGEKNVTDFLKHLMKRFSLSKAKLNQAREALVFFYAKVVKKPLEAPALPAAPQTA